MKSQYPNPRTGERICKECGSKFKGKAYVAGCCPSCSMKKRNAKSKAKGKKSLPSKKAIKKRTSEISKFREFAERVWNKAKHPETGEVYCENCPDTLLGIDFDPHRHGKCISHIKSKGAAPDLYYVEENVNILCPACHNQYEFGDRKSMKIWPEIEKRLTLLNDIRILKSMFKKI